jgi:hypothetical protein
MLNLLIRIHGEENVIREFVMVQKTVAIDVQVEADCLRQPEPNFAFREIDRAVIEAHTILTREVLALPSAPQSFIRCARTTFKSYAKVLRVEGRSQAKQYQYAKSGRTHETNKK